MAYVMALQQGWPTDKMEFKSEQASIWTLFRVFIKDILADVLFASQQRYSRAD
jgi:hypothetical protein